MIEPLEQIKKSILAAVIGSCECNTKSPEAAYHAGYCRYLKLLTALECIESLDPAAKQRVGRLEAAMKQVIDELEEDFDVVDGGDGQPAPNKAMRLANELQEAIYGPGGF